MPFRGFFSLFSLNDLKLKPRVCLGQFSRVALSFFLGPLPLGTLLSQLEVGTLDGLCAALGSQRKMNGKSEQYGCSKTSRQYHFRQSGTYFPQRLLGWPDPDAPCRSRKDQLRFLCQIIVS